MLDLLGDMSVKVLSHPGHLDLGELSRKQLDFNLVLRIFQKHKIQVNFKPGQTLRHRLVHSKDKTPRHKLSNVVYAVQCKEECSDLYIGETKLPLNRRMAQNRRSTSSGQDSAIHLHLEEKGPSFKDSNVRVLD